MKALLFSCLSIICLQVCSAQDQDALLGRWDLTFDMSGTEQPGWLEITHSGHSTLVGRIVVISGSSRPISEVKVTDGMFKFAIPPQWERGQDLVFTGFHENAQLKGTMIYADGQQYQWVGVRAPKLMRAKAPEWGKEVTLFNGKDLTGWHVRNETRTGASVKNQWVAENGILKSPSAGENLFTDGLYTDFKLHIEFRYPKDGNSGIYLRGRHEVQIADSKGQETLPVNFSSVYGFLSPSKMMAKDPGEWQTYDITLIGRMITVVANGETVICNQEIPGITGGAIDSHEGEPGPIYLQGDHQPIEYRNIRLTPAK